MPYWQLELVSGIVSCPEVLPSIQEALPLSDSFLSGGALRQLPEAFLCAKHRWGLDQDDGTLFGGFFLQEPCTSRRS